MVTPEQEDVVQRAVAMMTAWLESDENPDLQDRVVEELVREEHGEAKLVVGLSNVVGILLKRVEKLSGATPAETLQDIAMRYRAR